MKQQARFLHIDILRAIAIVGMIITHVLSIHLRSVGITLIWNYLHFVVVGFVFCSAYVYAAISSQKKPPFIQWYIKRFSRLYIPYLIYLLCHYSLSIIFPWLYRGYGLIFTWDYFFRSLMLVGGVDLGWLPLLFLQLSLLFPSLLRLSRQKYAMVMTLSLLLLFVTATTFIRIPQVYSRELSWVPWSLIILLGFGVAQWERKWERSNLQRRILFAGLISGCIFLGLFSILSQYHLPLTLTLHKYPPDIFYLSYGVFVTSALYLVASRDNFLPPYITQFLVYISTNGYGLFFIHIIILDLVSTTFRLPVTTEILIVLLTSIALLYVSDVSQKYLRNFFR